MNKEIELEVICKCIDRGMGVNGEYDIETYMYCPNCNKAVGDYEDDELWYNYCPNCGQKLKYTAESHNSMIRVKGKLRCIERRFSSDTLETICERQLIELNGYKDVELPEGFDSYTEYIVDKYYNRYMIRNGSLYEITIFEHDIKEEFFCCEYTKNNVLAFHVKFDSKEMDLHEALNKAIDNMYDEVRLWD